MKQNKKRKKERTNERSDCFEINTFCLLEIV